MIITEFYKTRADGVALNRTYSDKGMMIEREGVHYEEAIDPAELNRQYTETDEPVEAVTEEATAEDYQSALREMGEEVLYKNGYRIIANITAENPFMSGDKGWYNGMLYQSKLDNNVWTPDEFPAGWVLTDEGGNE